MITVATITIREQYNNEGDCQPRLLSRAFGDDATLQDIRDWTETAAGGPELRGLLSGPALSFQDDIEEHHEDTDRLHSAATAQAPQEEEDPYDNLPF